MSKTELLLPAGSYDSLKAAIANGADAVYMAGAAYGARANAENFHEENMQKAVNLAHQHNVRVYVTMNTLILPDEFLPAMDYAKYLYAIGVDALILQDIGLSDAVHHVLPHLPIHGSTQMTIHNVATAKYAEKMGFSRVILARELSLSDILAIKEACPSLELEVFVHGALCISYSGQCLTSSFIGGRSGNRGKCAQPCRMTYTLLDDKGGTLSDKELHLLSPRDLCTIDIIDEIIHSGVASLKIEGRMRRPEYVATVGAIYRKALDGVVIDDNDKNELLQVFNRDFTSGYFINNPQLDLMSHLRPNNRGIAIGRVVSYEGKSVMVKLTAELVVGDGIEVWVKIGGRVGVTVSQIKLGDEVVDEAHRGDTVELFIDGRCSVGDRVFKTYDYKLMSKAIESYQSLDADKKVSFNVRAHVGDVVTVVATDEDGRTAIKSSDYVVELARNRGAYEDDIRKQMSRLGGSGYCLADLTCDLNEGIMIPASVLNNLRRDVVDELVAAEGGRVSYPAISNKDFTTKVKQYSKSSERIAVDEPMLCVKVKSLSQLFAAVKSGADIVYFATYLNRQPLTLDEWQKVSNIVADSRSKVALCLSPIRHDSHTKQVLKEIYHATQAGIDSVIIGHAGDVELVRDISGIKHIYGDYTLNIYNQATINKLAKDGLCQVSVSMELNRETISGLTATNTCALAMVVHGFMPMMTTKHCIMASVLGGATESSSCSYNCNNKLFYLEDRINVRFPLFGDQYHANHIYNGRELCLCDSLHGMSNIAVWQIEGILYDENQLNGIINLYKDVRDSLHLKKKNRPMYTDRIKEYSLLPYTKGHFNKGV